MSDNSSHADAGHGIVVDASMGPQPALVALIRVHDHLFNAAIMARMTVFTVDRDRKATIIVGEPWNIGEDKENENARAALRRLIPTANIQPFLERLESALNGDVTEASHECEIGTSFPPIPVPSHSLTKVRWPLVSGKVPRLPYESCHRYRLCHRYRYQNDAARGQRRCHWAREEGSGHCRLFVTPCWED